MKIGFLQFAPFLGDVRATMRSIDRLIDRASLPDLLVLPELCNSGYNFQSAEQAWETSEEIRDSVFVRYLEGPCAGSSACIWCLA